jgi:GPH family glycoside/pentoside/hexuronide:cation symporter
MTSRNARLSVAIKAGWAAGDLGIACYVGGTMAFLLFFLTQAHGISPAWAGVALLVPRLIDVLADPLMGAVSDRTVTSMGRRRPYLLFGSIAFAVTFYLTFTMPAFADPRVGAIYAMVMYLLASLAYTVYAIPHAAMVAEMSADYRERTSIVGYRMVGSRLGILAVGLGGPILFASGATLREGFARFALVYAIVILIGGIVSFRATRNAPRLDPPVATFRWRDELRALAENRPFRALFMVFLLQNIAIGMSATTLVYFLTFTMDVQMRNVGWFSAGAAMVATLATPVWMRAGQVWGVGKKRVYAIAIVIQIVAYGAVFVLAHPGAIVLFAALLVLAGIGDAACQLAPASMVPDTVEADEIRSGVRREGTIFGALSGCLKLGMAVGAFLVSIAFDLAGFVPGAGPGAQAGTAVAGVRAAYCLVPVFLWVVALFLLRRYDLDEAQHRLLRERIGRETLPQGASPDATVAVARAASQDLVRVEPAPTGGA